MRVTTAFNRILSLPGASVAKVTFTPEGTVIGLRRRFRRLTCACGWSTNAAYDSRIRRWRHLDLGAGRLFLECEIRRLDCQECGKVRTEIVPWARLAARHTRDYEDVVAWLAQRVDKTTIATLLRCSWETVHNIVQRVVIEHIDDDRLNNLYRIGVDEISFRKGHRYLTVVADHDRDGAVVWTAEGKNAEVLKAFYAELGAERTAQLEAVSLDLGGAYKKATDDAAPNAQQCADPFHVVARANDAIDKTRRIVWGHARQEPSPRRGPGALPKGTPPPPRPKSVQVKRSRWALVKNPETLSDDQWQILRELKRQNSVLYRCWQLKEGLRDLYRLQPARAGEHLDWWLAWACRSRIPAFVTLSRTLRANRDRVLAAIELGLSNSKLEGLNSKIRLINHRGYGHHSAAAVIAMIYLCCGGITITLPTQT